MTYHLPENEDLAPNELPEVKEARRKAVEELTAAFLAQGGKVQQIPTGVSAKRLRAIPARHSGGAPILVINDDERRYKQGQNPESSNSRLFEDKKKPR